MSNTFQKIICFNWVCNKFDGSFQDKKWIYKETLAVTNNSPHCMDPGVYIDKDNKKAYRYTNFAENMDCIVEDKTPPTINIECPVYFKYEVRKYDTNKCEGTYTVVQSNLYCECIEGTDTDCYDKEWNRARIQKLNNCIINKDGQALKIVVIGGPYPTLEDAHR